MKILAVDTSTAMATAAVSEDGKLLALSSAMSPKGHSQKIFGLLKRVLEESNTLIEEIDVFACSIGPGSFTGLRIGATAVTGLAHGMKKELVGLPTLDVLAAGIYGFGGYVCPILDAQRSSVYSALYCWIDGELKKIENFGVVEMDKLEDRIHQAILSFLTEEEDNEEIQEELGELVNLSHVLFCGDGVPLFREKIQEFKRIKPQIAKGDKVYPSAAVAAWLAEESVGKGAPGTLRLEYIRKAQAEVEYSHRNPINIRMMDSNDIEQVHDIESLCFSTPWSEDSFRQEMENPMAFYLVAEVGGRVAGYAGIWQIIDEGHITNVGVHPGFQGMGIGEKLMRELIKESEKRLLFNMTLEVRVSNLSAINLYKKLKFHEAGVRKGYYTDTREDGLIMWLNMKE